MRPLLFLSLAILAVASRPGAAESTPRCTPQREGEVACFAGKLCECRHDPGGVLAGRPAGTRWNCGPLRPACGAVPEAGQPAERAPPVMLPWPPPSPDWR